MIFTIKLLKNCHFKTNNHGEGAVHVAAGLGQLEILKALASKGTNLGVTDYRGDSAVYWAARQGHEEVIQFLVSQGVLINQQNKASSFCSPSKGTFKDSKIGKISGFRSKGKMSSVELNSLSK